MISLRLPKELEDKLEYLSEKENITKSDVVREALEKYIAEYDKSLHAYALGEEFFGKYESGGREALG